MGSSHSQSKLKEHRKVKPFCDGSNSFRRVSDGKGIEYLQASLGEVHKKETNSQKETGIVSWWKHLISRLTRSGNTRTLDGSLTPETHRLDSILTNIACDSDGETSLPSMIPHQRCSVNKYNAAQRKPDQQGTNNCESYVLIANDSPNNSSNIGLNIRNGRPPTDNDNGVSSRHRSRSPTPPYVKTSHKPSFTDRGNDTELEEVCIAQAEVMYTKATWRMYERITSFRTATAVSNQRFCVPAVQPRSDVNTALPPTEERGLCFQRLQPYHQHAHLEHYDTQITDSETLTQHLEEAARDDQISRSGLSVDSHHICFEMDQD